MFLYLMTMIPCDWIAKIEVLDCVASSNDASSTCITAVNETEEIFQVSDYSLKIKRSHENEQWSGEKNKKHMMAILLRKVVLW